MPKQPSTSFIDGIRASSFTGRSTRSTRKPPPIESVAPLHRRMRATHDEMTTTSSRIRIGDMR